MRSAISNNSSAPPFNKNEARRVWQRYRHLQGQEYLENGTVTGIIECVAVGPYDDINRYIFLEYYLDCGDPWKALEFYHAPFFDVVLFIRTYAEQKLMLMPASDYLGEKQTQL